MIQCYVVPYALGSNEHCVVPIATCTSWDKDHAVAVVEISREELDVLREQMDQWCSYQDRMDELVQENRGTG